jgi:hypothetical protein
MLLAIEALRQHLDRVALEGVVRAAAMCSPGGGAVNWRRAGACCRCRDGMGGTNAVCLRILREVQAALGGAGEAEALDANRHRGRNGIHDPGHAQKSGHERVASRWCLADQQAAGGLGSRHQRVAGMAGLAAAATGFTQGSLRDRAGSSANCSAACWGGNGSMAWPSSDACRLGWPGSWRARITHLTAQPPHPAPPGAIKRRGRFVAFLAIGVRSLSALGGLPCKGLECRVPHATCASWAQCLRFSRNAWGFRLMAPGFAQWLRHSRNGSGIRPVASAFVITQITAQPLSTRRWQPQGSLQSPVPR